LLTQKRRKLGECWKLTEVDSEGALEWGNTKFLQKNKKTVDKALERDGISQQGERDRCIRPRYTQNGMKEK